MVIIIVAVLIVVAAIGAIVLVGPHLSYSPEQDIVALAGLRTDDGLRTEDVAAAVHEDLGATVRALQQLQAGGYVETVPGGGLPCWRLTAAYRAMPGVPDVRRRG